MKENLLTMLLSLLIPLGAVAKEAYAVFTEDGTLTFYYDDERGTRSGTTYDLNTGDDFPGWWSEYESEITQVVFASSFRDARPISTFCWFYNCSKLTSLDLSNLNTSNVTNMEGVFSGCSGLTSLDLSNLNTSNVTDMYGMFYDCKSLTLLDLSNFNTSNVTNMSYMFYNCSGLTSLDLSNFNTGNVTYMSRMISGCSSLTSLDLSNLNTSNVTDMSSMFMGCSGLTSLDVSHFNTSNVTKMGGVFYNCGSLTSLDLSHFNTSNVTDMSSMFFDCSSLISLDLSNFNTSNVTDMRLMFYRCSSLTLLDMSHFNTSNVTKMNSMFANCRSLTTIYSRNDWDTDKVTNSERMFSSCIKLVGGAGTAYNSSYTDKTYARIDGGPDAPGYFTLKPVILDENSTEWPVASDGEAEITVKRTIKAGEWSTICLPFKMTEEQVKEVFGADVQLKEYVGYNVYLDNDKNVTGINLNFVDVDLTDGFHWNHPYLIKVSKDIEEFKVTSTIDPDEREDMYIEQYDGVREKNINGGFYGNPVPRVLDSGELFLSGNKFWYSTGLTKIKGLRATFRLYDSLMSADDASARISMSFNDSESTTGIRSLTPALSEGEGACYDLSGRRVEKPTRGLYIKGNKKVFVK